MSCSQVQSEFTKDKFALKHPHPSSFCVWRYTCFSTGRSYPIYRILFAALFHLLVVLDYLWIIGFDAVGSDNRVSACLDASQFALILLCVAYNFLAYCANKWDHSLWDLSTETSIPYRMAWFLYTCSVNAVFSTTVLFWVFSSTNSSLEPKLKYTIPACLILLDLSLSSIPLYFCHVVYTILVAWFYLAVCTLGLYLSYVVGLADRTASSPPNPTVWIGGQQLIPHGFADLSNVHRILATTFGSAAMCIVLHCVLLSFVILRDFVSSLFSCSTEVWIEQDQLGPNMTEMFFASGPSIASSGDGKTPTPLEPTSRTNPAFQSSTLD